MFGDLRFHPCGAATGGSGQQLWRAAGVRGTPGPRRGGGGRGRAVHGGAPRPRERPERRAGHAAAAPAGGAAGAAAGDPGGRGRPHGGEHAERHPPAGVRRGCPGIGVTLLSGGRSGAIEQRARHLGIAHCRTGVGDKQAGLAQLHRELGMTREVTAFLGDDLNDLAVRPVCGLLVAPADAALALRRQADWVLCSRGGDGALRELTEALLASQGLLQELYRIGWRDGND